MQLEKLRYRKPCLECKTMLEFPTHKARNEGKFCFICKELRRKKRLRVYNKDYRQRQEVQAKEYERKKKRRADPKWREKRRKQSQSWRARHPEERKAQDKRYRESHREKLRETARNWYNANKDKVKKYPSQSKEAKHAYYLKHKAELMRKQKERRAKRRAEKKA